MTNSHRVAFQGERGAYSEAATVAFFSEQVEPVPCKDFETVFEMVTSDQVKNGVLPVENSLGGSIHRNYDLLLRNERLYIIGEVQIPIAHQLIALPGISLSDVTTVYSHPQGLAQCEYSITKRLPHVVERIPTYDTAGSVKMIKEQQIKNGAGLASSISAQIYDMNILMADMQDDSENYTRFVVVGPEPVIPTGEAKTSIVFSVKNMAGVLFKTLAVFALRDIDLTKLESRPLQGKRWQYFFYLDFMGSQYEERCQNALNHLQEITTYFRVLGSYPRGV
ncbi:prephenate dehydratase [Anaerolineales bacterium HSG6]|nr:prephenate dehydratase [Anaerolineales bacterium HSG6]MDM8531786.1 prephenate dehydratase [Anaerolineales bacterium HSG25]